MSSVNKKAKLIEIRSLKSDSSDYIILAIRAEDGGTLDYEVMKEAIKEYFTVIDNSDELEAN